MLFRSSPTPIASPSPSVSPTPISSATPSASPTPVVSPTPKPTTSPSPTPSASPSPSASPTPSTSPTPATKTAQTITFPTLANRFFNDVGTPLLATSSSGLAVTYTVSGPCKLLYLDGGKVSTQPDYVQNGPDTVTCTFTASQVGNTTFAAATPVSQNLVVTKQATVVNFILPASISVSGSFLYAYATTTDGKADRSQRIGNPSSIYDPRTFTFTSTTPTVCSVSEQSAEDSRGSRITVRARTNGMCTVQANFEGTSSVKTSQAFASFQITGINSPAPGSNTTQTIDFPALIDWEKAQAQPLAAKASSGLQITYLSLTPEICWVLYPASGPVVQRQGKVPDAPFWTCTIRALQTGDDRYVAAQPVERSFKFLKASMVIAVTTPSSLVGAGPHQVISTLAYVDKTNMSGLTSLGSLLTVVSLTPAVCKVNSNELWDRTGGIVNRTYVAGLDNGTCSLKFDFAGSTDRQPATLTWNGTVSSILKPTGSSLIVQAISGNVINGKEVVGPMPATGANMYLSGLDKGQVQFNVSAKATDPNFKIGVSSSGVLQTDAASWKATILTPTTCIARDKVAITYGQYGISAFVLPIAVGTCSIKFDFAGTPSLMVGGSTYTWSATVKN